MAVGILVNPIKPALENKHHVETGFSSLLSSFGHSGFLRNLSRRMSLRWRYDYRPLPHIDDNCFRDTVMYTLVVSVDKELKKAEPTFKHGCAVSQ